MDVLSVGDKVRVNNTAGFSRGSYGDVTKFGINQYADNVVYVKRYGSSTAAWFLHTELELVEVDGESNEDAIKRIIAEYP